MGLAGRVVALRAERAVKRQMSIVNMCCRTDELEESALLAVWPARTSAITRSTTGVVRVIRQQMCDTSPTADVRHMAWETEVAVRGRWPLMLRTGWVVVGLPRFDGQG